VGDARSGEHTHLVFLTVTLNPALDKTLCVDRNAPNETLRATASIDLAGGKGVNVARALLALGARARVLAPLGGHPGAQVADLARAEGMEVAAVPVAGQTRLALTIRDAESGRYWHYLEPGPELEPEEVVRVERAFSSALEGCHTAILCGSLPSAAAAPLVPWMIRTAAERGLRAALDSFGPWAKPALEAGPWLAKPNLFEWQSTFGERLESDAARWGALAQMARWGVRMAVLSMGAAGALAIAEGERYRIVPPEVEEVNDLGSGDSMVAGICWAAAQGIGARDCLAWGAACGAANAAVWDPGAINLEEVKRLLPQVAVRGE
jgi:1-phosphofructokinase family hexose kinase